jgi:predicted nucleic acid-binding protein
MPVAGALSELRSLLESPSLVLLSETARHPEVMDALLRQSGVAGNLVHDAHIAALCLEHGVNELVTADRDFLRFGGLRVFNPLAEARRRD